MDMKKLIKRIKKDDLNDEQLLKDVMITLLIKVDQIYKLLNKPSPNCQTDPFKLKDGDILIGENE